MARIADDEPQHRLILVGSRRVGNGEVDGPPLRVFDRVGQEVDEDLLDAPRVPVQAVGDFGVDLDMELEPLGLGPWAHHAGDRLDQLRQPVFRFHDAELARLDLREIEDVVDNGKQRGARRADAPRIAPHRGVLRLPQDHLVQTQYRIDRRADLVAHAGEEFALGLAGLVRQLFLFFQRFAAGGFFPRHDQVRAHRQKDHQQEGGDPDAAGKDGGHGPGHRPPGNVARHGAVGMGEVRGEQEILLLVQHQIRSRGPVGLELRAEKPQSLLHFRRPEELRVLFVVCTVRHDHLPVPVMEQQPHGGIERRHAEMPGNHPFGVEAAQHAGNVAAAHQRDGENQAVSRLVVHHGLPVHRDGEVLEGAVRQNVAQDGFPVNGDHAYGDARFHAAKLPQETLLGLVAGGGLQTAGRQGEHG